MTLDEYLKSRRVWLDSFAHMMRDRVPKIVETSEEGWDTAYKIWHILTKRGIQVKVIDQVLGSLLGGWYSKES